MFIKVKHLKIRNKIDSTQKLKNLKIDFSFNSALFYHKNESKTEGEVCISFIGKNPKLNVISDWGPLPAEMVKSLIECYLKIKTKCKKKLLSF